MDLKNISIKDFSYHLPQEKIAKYPLEKRDESKLLVYKNGTITDSNYKFIANEIEPETLLICNNTKVVEARLLFTKESGSIIQIFCLEPADNYKDITTAMLQKEKVLWKCLVGGAKKWKEEHLMMGLNFTDAPEAYLEYKDGLVLTAKKIEKFTDYFLIEFSWNATQLSFAEVLHFAGEIPLPPYLNREVEEKDKATYQTVYAKHDGSVAAPTAGLHFTKEVFESLQQKNITIDYVTLHVGAGTFKPVKAEQMKDHEMHSEYIDVDIELIKNIYKNYNKKIIAVGTTSLRTIESLYWMGVKLISNLNSQLEMLNQQLEIHQWDCYELPQNISVDKAFKALIDYLEANNLKRLLTKTQIIIAPGYTLKVANGIITNFHQPNSTLLLLISAIVGDDWKKIYNHALENEYRFLSYGDGSLLWK